MRLHRFFVEQPLESVDLIELPAATTHHCAQVLRYKKDDPLILFNGDGCDYHGVIISISKRQCQVSIVSRQALANESPLNVHLVQGIAKGDKMDFIIQKAVELGVAEMTPLFTEHCNVKLNQQRLDKKQQHWQKIMLSACEQSGRARLMTLHPAVFLSQFSPQHDQTIYLEPQANLQLKDLNQLQSIQLLIGPEGGFSEQDLKRMQQLKVIGIKLGKRILRTETAGLAAISVLQSLFGDF